jgi:hypothetical protein
MMCNQDFITEYTREEITEIVIMIRLERVQYKKVHNKQHGSKSKKPLDSSQLLV